MSSPLSAAEIETILRSSLVYRIAGASRGQPYCVPVSLAYDGQSLFGQSSPGRKLEMMRESAELCVETEQIDDLMNWRSVIAWGRYEELSGEEALRTLRAYFDRVVPFIRDLESGRQGYPHSVEEIATRGAVYRIRLLAKSGRFESKKGEYLSPFRRNGF
ncbi:MAG: pyridoxamine 5'-phosphate oxidase family protein [Thermoanaerobaculia bacterium]